MFIYIYRERVGGRSGGLRFLFCFFLLLCNAMHVHGVKSEVGAGQTIDYVCISVRKLVYTVGWGEIVGSAKVRVLGVLSLFAIYCLRAVVVVFMCSILLQLCERFTVGTSALWKYKYSV